MKAEIGEFRLGGMSLMADTLLFYCLPQSGLIREVYQIFIMEGDER
jgi:hypothetical protein